jgi:hypothetical protein
LHEFTTIFKAPSSKNIAYPLQSLKVDTKTKTSPLGIYGDILVTEQFATRKPPNGRRKLKNVNVLVHVRTFDKRKLLTLIVSLEEAESLRRVIDDKAFEGITG